MEKPVLYVIACGGRPASDLPRAIPQLQETGWEVCVIATPSALNFVDADELASITGYAVRSRYKHPDEPDVLPLADAIAVAPATFNTINKLAGGSSDTLALGILNEAIGLRLPIVAVPAPNAALARHPAFQAAIRDLRSWGVTLLFDPDRYPLSAPDRDGVGATPFPWDALLGELEAVRQRLAAR